MKSNSKRKTFNWGWLTVQMFSPWWEAWQQEGRHGTVEVAESSPSRSADRREREKERETGPGLTI